MKRNFEFTFDPRNPAQYVALMEQHKAAPGALTKEEWNARMPRNRDGTLAEGADKPSVGEFLTRLQLQLESVKEIAALKARGSALGSVC